MRVKEIRKCIHSPGIKYKSPMKQRVFHDGRAFAPSRVPCEIKNTCCSERAMVFVYKASDADSGTIGNSTLGSSERSLNPSIHTCADLETY